MTAPTLPDQPCDLSLVIPVYNEEEIFAELIRRLGGVLDTTPCRADLILVSDGSRDRTGDLLRQVRADDARFVGIHLSRNIGRQTAVSAGIYYARRRTAVVTDDCPHAPAATWLCSGEREDRGEQLAVRKCVSGGTSLGLT